MNLNEQDFERVLSLKRTPLFSFLPLDTLLAVSRVLETRHCLAGAEIVSRGAAQDHLGILERGAVEVVSRGGSERLEAPACFGELVLLGEPPLFPRHEEVELSWRILDPVERYWARQKAHPEQYVSGGWGPDSTDALMRRDGREWRLP